jgi:uncharacterized heparinase superfamily protein
LNPSSFKKYVRTARHLKPIQIYDRVTRGFRSKRVPRIAAPDLRQRTGKWVAHIQRPSAQICNNTFRFLNEEHEIRTWNDPGRSKLWLYNLHYFDSPSPELIERWIDENASGSGNGWEPYPLSLRITNWIKYELGGGALPQVALRSLAQQSEALLGKIEYHLLGNHLLANAKALLFAGAFFSGPSAASWLNAGQKLLSNELREQILRDGGHIERSPMYHALILEDVLDLVNLSRLYPGVISDFQPVAGPMLAWLKQMTHPDGEISFFNDAALGIAPTPAQISDYARALNVFALPTELGTSGYIRLEHGPAVVIFDAAEIGPDYQPGHAHADTLSFELSLRGQRVLVNSGTSTYENNAERSLQRGTAAHNTLRVDGLDQSEMWGAFRVARRAHCFDICTDHQRFAEASHTGYHRLSQPVTHRRRIELGDKEVTITDKLDGLSEHLVEIFFHNHPGTVTTIEFDPKMEVSAEDSNYHPQFGISIPNRRVVGRWRGRCPASFTTRVQLISGQAVC